MTLLFLRASVQMLATMLFSQYQVHCPGSAICGIMWDTMWRARESHGLRLGLFCHTHRLMSEQVYIYCALKQRGTALIDLQNTSRPIYCIVSPLCSINAQLHWQYTWRYWEHCHWGECEDCDTRLVHSTQIWSIPGIKLLFAVTLRQHFILRQQAVWKCDEPFQFFAQGFDVVTKREWFVHLYSKVNSIAKNGSKLL